MISSERLHRVVATGMLIGVVVASICPVSTVLARPQDNKAQARRLFRQANELFGRKMYLDALRKYREARALYPSYKIDLNIGGALDALGRRTEAAVYFERFLIQSSAAPPAIIQAARARLDDLRSKLSSVKVTCAVEGATVVVDGAGVGSTPLELPVYFEPGKHSIQARKAGYRCPKKALELAAGQHLTVDLLLERGEAIPEAVKPATLPAAAPRASVEDPQRTRKRRTRSIWGYTALSLAAAAAVTAVVLYGVGGAQGSAAYDRYQAATEPAVIESEYQAVEAAKAKLVAGHVLMGVAAAAAGVSIYSFLTRPERVSPARGTRIGMAPLLDGAALSLLGHF